MINLHFSRQIEQMKKKEFFFHSEVESHLEKIAENGFVYLVALEAEDYDEVFITSHKERALIFAKNTNWYMDSEIFFFQLSSFDEAYAIALQMKEPNPLCYEQK